MHDFPRLTLSRAEAFAATALANVVEEYPHKLDHVMAGDGDVQPPRALHPAFHGSYDWHSCVHMHWLLVHARRLFPELTLRPAIEAVLDRHLDGASIAAECAYLQRPDTQAFERTYGWAWLLKLATELAASADEHAGRWHEALAPLAEGMVARYLEYLPRARYPVRYGMHANSAFGLAFALDYARAMCRGDLEAACLGAAMSWFGADRDAPARWEPSGADFLSPVLMEAELMGRVLDGAAFVVWLDAFLPQIARSEPAALFTPAEVDDRSDPQIVHLDGLNLSRAWCWRGLAAVLAADDPRRARAAQAARVHLEAGLAGLSDARYVGTHWLASFAALALAQTG